MIDQLNALMRALEKGIITPDEANDLANDNSFHGSLKAMMADLERDLAGVELPRAAKSAPKATPKTTAAALKKAMSPKRVVTEVEPIQGKRMVGTIQEALGLPTANPEAAPEAKPHCLRTKRVAEAEARLARLLGEPTDAPVTESVPANQPRTLTLEDSKLMITHPSKHVILRKLP